MDAFDFLDAAGAGFGQAVNGGQDVHRNRPRDGADVGLGSEKRIRFKPIPCSRGCPPW